VLAARNVQEARRGTIFAGFLKILPVFIFVLPGIIAAALYADVRNGQADSAYPILVTRLLPIGFKGLVLAGINFLHFAALLFALCSAILIVVSYVTPPPASERVADLTLQTATKEVDTADTPRERRVTIAFSVLLAATIGALWIVFR
jgi:uncharacterized sodium:solute symporter family permease YidK